MSADDWFGMETQITNPYAPPAADAPFTTDGDVALAFWPLASRGQRLGASLLDSLLVLFPAIAILTARALLIAKGDSLVYLATGLSVCVGAGVQLYFQIRFGQSVGKRLLGIRVVRMDGQAPSLARILLHRNLAPMVLSRIPFAGGVFGLADAVAIFGANSRCLHDHIADTKVIRVQR